MSPRGVGRDTSKKTEGASRIPTTRARLHVQACSKTTVRVPGTITQEVLRQRTKNKQDGKLPERRKSKTEQAQDSGRRNSKPKIRSSPADSWRRTRAEIGGVS